MSNTLKKALFLYNRQSGKGRIGRNVEAVVALFRDAGYVMTDRKSVV